MANGYTKCVLLLIWCQLLTLTFHAMATNPHDEHHLFRCGACQVISRGSEDFKRHMRNLNHPSPHPCGECDLTFEHFTSLMRHIRASHYHDNIPNPLQGHEDVPPEGGAENVPPILEDNAAEEMEATGALPVEDVHIDLARSAGQMVLNLRQSGSITGSAIERFEEAAFHMIQDVTSVLKLKVKQFLIDQNIYGQEAQNMLRELNISDPFEHIKTLKQQLNYFASEFGLVKPETKFLDYRIDYRLNPQTSHYEPVRVPMSFEYVSVIETLTVLMKNPKIRIFIDSEVPSEDGVSRSYLDGSRAKTHPLVLKFPKIIRIQIYWDDIEVVNALGSKTSIHKIAAFYFSLQNMPAVENSQLSSVYLLALAYSQDMKQPGAFQTILAPFLYELRKLESEKGVMIEVDGKPYCLRATLTVLCADTLAAHEILGFLAPSANYFCRKCMVFRGDFRQDLNAMGVKRTRPMFEEHVKKVKENKRFSSQCGVRTSCPLHLSQNFDATQDAPFDILHDLLEGVCHWVISLTLRAFITVNKYFTLEDFNGRITAFNLGIPDAKNRPSSNFTEDSLKGSKLKQKGCQMWCLTRMFGFLVADVPAENRHLKLVNLLQRIMLIAFSEKARPTDTQKLDDLVEEHHKLFQELHITPDTNVLDELSDSDAEEWDADDPDQGDPAEPNAGKRKKWKKVSPGNKLHHMKHMGEDMRMFGNLILYWCMRYEARHHIFCKYGAVCCNFINIIKSMAQMFQVSTLAGLQKTSNRADDIELQSPRDITVGSCSHKSHLLEDLGLKTTDVITMVNAVQIAGEDYRAGLFVLAEVNTPTFALIHEVYVQGPQVLLVVEPWKTVEFTERYCAYKVEPAAAPTSIVRHNDLARHGSFAPWNPWQQRVTYIAPRTIIF